jgi:hypothetical protein
VYCFILFYLNSLFVLGGFSSTQSQPQSQVFDPFNSGSNQNQQFANFGSSAAVAPQTNNLDFFQQPSAQPQAALFMPQQQQQFQQQPANNPIFPQNDFFQQGNFQGSPQVMQQPMQQPMQGGFTSSASSSVVSPFQQFPQQSQQQPMGMASQQQQQQQQQQQFTNPSGVYQTQTSSSQNQNAMPQTVFTTRSNDSNDSDFGGFETAPQANIKGGAGIQDNKFSSFGALVDLGKLTSKAEEQKKQASQSSNQFNNTSSFAGLDGFSKTPQNVIYIYFLQYYINFM